MPFLVRKGPLRVLLCVLEGLECHPRPTDRLVCVVVAAVVSLVLVVVVDCARVALSLSLSFA